MCEKHDCGSGGFFLELGARPWGITLIAHTAGHRGKPRALGANRRTKDRTYLGAPRNFGSPEETGSPPPTTPQGGTVRWEQIPLRAEGGGSRWGPR